MFRPEMLAPMGFPKDVHVHGWGISLERPTMIRCVRPAFPPTHHIFPTESCGRYGINNIRTLVGHKVPIDSVEKSAAVRF